MKYIKKYKFIILIIIITIIRFLMSYKLPSFYIVNLKYDDRLMVNLFKNILNGNYLGNYDNLTLIKGSFFPLLLVFSRIIKVNYSVFFTLLYILACIFFTTSLKDIIKNKKILIIIYIILLFNPISYSSDLFQRLYRNSISIIELLFFLGVIIRIIKNNEIIDYIYLGFIISFMFLTREDSMWIIIILLVMFIYKIKNIRIIIPIVILLICLNMIAFANYKKYGIYTYNEITNSAFNKTYMKILRIKDEKKVNRVSITHETLHKLSDLCDTFNITKEELDNYYKKLSDDNKEINNGNMIWYFRQIVYKKNRFMSARESEEYYKKLGREIDELGLAREFTIPSIFINTPSIKELSNFPKDLINGIIYSSSYKNVKTLTNFKKYRFNKYVNAYMVRYDDYHNTENIVKKNSIQYEIIRVFYKYFTIIVSIISLIIYIRNIRKFDIINKILHILVISYLLILFGVIYTHTTAFPAIRYFYLGNIYILQSIFILLNLVRVFDNNYKE